MAKYAKYQRKSQRRSGENPLWRGVGCVLMIVVPLITYVLTTILTPAVVATGLVPNEFRGHVQFPDWAYKMSVTSGIASFIGGINDLWLKVIEFFIILLLLSGVSSLVYTVIMQLIGPPRYTAFDAPPPKYKPKVYKR